MQRNKRLLKLKKSQEKKRRQLLVQAHKQKTTTALTDVPRCTAKLKSGKRCCRSAGKKVRGAWRCWQHEKV